MPYVEFEIDRDAAARYGMTTMSVNQIIETATVMVVGLDQNGRILLFNDMAEQVTGYRRQDAMGQDWLALMVPAAHRGAMSEEFRRLRTRSAASDELVCPIATATGEERMIAWRNSVVVEKAEVLATLSFGIDITEEAGVLCAD